LVASLKDGDEAKVLVRRRVDLVCATVGVVDAKAGALGLNADGDEGEKHPEPPETELHVDEQVSQRLVRYAGGQSTG
jgi:hypothetical protein